MQENLSRRKFLGGTAAALASTAALSGEAAAHQVGSSIYTSTDLNIRDGPGLEYDVIRTAPENTGMYIVDGPWSSDGYTWWKVQVNGDSNDYSRYTGYCVQTHTSHADFALPATGQVTSTYWDCRDDCNRYHRAMDIANDKGTAIHAARGGTVSFAGWASGYGYVVYVDHESGYQTRYAHLNDIYVSEGESVNKGTHVGAMGNTGTSTGDHVHFEIRRDGSKLNWPMTKYAYVWRLSGAPKNFSGI
jgi:murein DD-endopeptidase MepM/ murein hydrolase activator NlpD